MLQKKVFFLADNAGDICGKPLKIIWNTEPTPDWRLGVLAA
jgi:hypothetical protein